MENYVGKRLDGRYEIQDVIGVGGMAVVYKAYDNIDDRIVAVKILKEEYLANEEFRRRFKNESKAIAVMSHRNIVKVFDVSFGDRLQYIVMEYIEGITLKEYIDKKGSLEWREALFFAIQILKALQHAHDKGIVHRDVKPQNIMLLENGTIKVADFGIARFSHSETRTMTEKAIGSVHYISPEQAKGELTDEKADIYSVGIVLYEMLTGKLPFDGDSAVSVALMQVNKQPELPRTIKREIPVGFEQIIMKSMQKSTRDRYQSAAEILYDLEELKRNPSVKFDYQTDFSDDSNRFATKVDTPVVKKTQVKTVPPATDIHKKLENNNAKTIGAVQDVGPTRKINTKTVGVIAGIAVAVIIFIIILFANMLKNGTISFGGKKVEVDNFVGMNYIEEIKDNEEYNEKFNFEVVYEPFTDGKEGCVFKQDPEAGSMVVKGFALKLYVATSGEGQVIPDFKGQNYNEACNSLEAMGFVVNAVPMPDSDNEIGSVVKTEPEAGSSALAGSTVTVYYAAEDSGKLFKMPDFSGKTLDEAKEMLTKYGLTLTKTEVVDTNVEKDRVVMQSPSKNSPVQKGDGVILTISSGKVVLEKSINIPSKIGVADIEVMVDNAVVSKTTVDTDKNSKYTLSVTSESAAASIKVFVNGKLYYEATGNFTKEPVNVTGEKYHSVAFYINVVGLDRSAAETALKKAGYYNISVIEVPSSERAGTVIGQSPSHSSAPNLDKTATIVLSVAAAETTQPTQPPTVPNSDIV
ncbi:MAG: Stk1 family PASTA domain-containing Ser/Thr kinase [Clostridia bacterium]|nr:Stk1 family PASTA domain-containing Ser/Thr kinase [Clostridia bacterium]